MISTISNHCLSVAVNSLGAAMTSIKATRGDEYLWEGNPAVWSGQAPNLFPVIGKVNNETYSWNGKQYHLKKHGFARTSEFTCLKQSGNEITYRLGSSDETLIRYPFEFDFDISFSLEENVLRVSYNISNRSQTVMPFSVGGHPALACNWTEGDAISDYYLEFDQVETCPYVQFNGVALSREEHPLLENSNTLDLTETIFDLDALVFEKLKSQAITLRSRKSDKQVRVEFPGFTYIGIWSKPKAPYVCIEPWYGVDDYVDSSGDIMEKDGIEMIEPGDFFQCEYRIVID